jgi:hypothetical protein
VPGRPPLRLALLPLLLAAGCTASQPEATGPVDVPVPSVAPAVRAVCTTLLGALPDEVDPGVERREVVGDASLTAAWGDPAVTLQCGVPEPDRPEEPVVVNGVAWSVRDIGAGFRWTTRDRRVLVAVDVPQDYENGAEIVNPLSGPIASAVPAEP